MHVRKYIKRRTTTAISYSLRKCNIRCSSKHHVEGLRGSEHSWAFRSRHAIVIILVTGIPRHKIKSSDGNGEYSRKCNITFLSKPLARNSEGVQSFIHLGPITQAETETRAMETDMPPVNSL